MKNIVRKQAIGSSGRYVKKFQTGLKAGGFDPGPIDSAYGSLTHEAVKDLQRYYDLSVDGIAGPITKSTLYWHLQ